ncbi:MULTISPECIES: hypothetical protein [unclassified Actinomyces]|uniref:hypothetical protein n=1 Tax=unclassified Actinomyces TaxID=2609248 RepID=UPI002016E803|nr:MULTISPECIES: hypothetical protein [unclassified Actinomyces]MCL3777297.1 hypothetical protein [Actinomyces sp. AC-20-1]MCL3789570.1 hypothetical protein [Actinomyces sp. 187325]MCL3791855.1 hypothetical protein [Actinomyces sp. 186855]MCL3793659.1 hypothetical protein [Actinomyces sp. 217892]
MSTDGARADPPAPDLEQPYETRWPSGVGTVSTLEQPYETRWSAGAGTVTALVVGGTCTVDTTDLDRLALALTTAGDRLDQARLDVLQAVTEVEDAVLPLVVEDPTGWADMWVGSPVVMSGSRPLPTGTTGGWAWDQDDGLPQPSWPRTSADVSHMLRQRHAVTALEALADGPGSLAVTAGALHDLAAAVSAAAEVYSGAESAARARWATGSLPALSTDVQTYTSSPTAALLGLGVLEAIRLLSANGAYLDDPDADLLQVATLLKDTALAPWAVQDLMLIVTASRWVQQAGTGTESAAVETYLADAARRLDPAVTERLPETVQVGSRRVATSSLTPMQRVAAYLAVVAAASGARRHGERTGVVVTPHGGSPVTVPTATVDPFALGTAVPAGAAATGRCVRSPATAADVIRYSAGLKHADTDTSTGVISVLRTDHADGTTSWLVVVPGTTDWGLGGSNPQDLLTNLEAVAGQPTDMESAVVTAMRAAGIQEGDAVGVYGHSQGAITASNVAADPAVAERFRITHLLTAGGPVAGAAVPDSVTVLHLEDTADVVPALDAAPTTTSTTRTTVLIDTTGAGIDGYPHGTEHYAQAVEHMGPEPALDSFTAGLAAVTGAGEEGAVTTEYVFDVERSTGVTPWEQVARAGTDGAADNGSLTGYPVGAAGTVFPGLSTVRPRLEPEVSGTGSGSASRW